MFVRGNSRTAFWASLISWWCSCVDCETTGAIVALQLPVCNLLEQNFWDIEQLALPIVSQRFQFLLWQLDTL